MATGKITKRTVDATQKGERQVLLWDTDVKGFGLRVMPTGAKSYVYQYRIGGRGNPTRRYTIGAHGAFTPDKARQRAEELARMVAKGIDPLGAERAERADQAAERARVEREAVRASELAFAAYAERFLNSGLASDTRERTIEGYRGTLRNHVTPVLGSMTLPEIGKADVNRVLDGIPTDQPSVRRIAFAVMRLLFRWAKARDDIAASPIDDIKPPKSPASRDRVLRDEELALALRAAAALEKPFGPFFELLFATGQRRDEVAGLDWSELDRGAALWTLPGDRSKNGEPNLVPLNRHAFAVLERLGATTVADKIVWPKRGLVFTTNGETSISGYSRAKVRLDAKMVGIARQDAKDAGEDPDAITLDDWRLHDARRTLATALQRLGVRFEVTEAVLNHTAGASRSGVAAVYQRHNWAAEKREALHRWAEHCDHVLAPDIDQGGNVIALPKRSPA
jgi:integrase